MKKQILEVSTKRNATGMTGVEMFGTTQVEFIKVAETHPKWGAVFTVAFCDPKNPLEMKVENYNERFFTPQSVKALKISKA